VAVLTALERPAGRPASGARPAGARALIPVEGDGEHGTPRGVRWHRMTKVPTCDACRRAAADQRAAQRKRAYLRRGDRLVDGCGVRRRLNALAAIGWSRHALAAELGCDRSNVQKVVRSKRSAPETVAAVRELYDRLSMTPGPHAAARATAIRRGWAPPLAWDDHDIDDPTAQPSRTGGREGRATGPAFDEVAVARAMRGNAVHLRPVERAEAVRRLTAQGASITQIAERLNTTTRSVSRRRSADTSRRSA
jgi:transcriptional regulator with XRE-family HTH domain